ncbi:MAG: tetratricopeptide repeat protein [Selenomonadaceae bacterium]|nr:tetratricopeptide repeat protein [Selenomonadaceae bacterium]
MKKFFATLLTAGLIFTTSTVNAELKTYTGTDEYIMSEFETLDIAKQRAKQKAERNAQEKAGVYIHSYSETKDMELVTDEIVSITCGIMSVTDVKYDVTPLTDVNGFAIRATVTAQIETDDVNKWLEKGSQERSDIVAQNKELQKAVAEQNATIENLKAQIAQLKADGKINGEGEREKFTQEFEIEDKVFLANQKLEEAQKKFFAHDFPAVIKLCSEALELNPNSSIAYGKRGAAYSVTNQAQLALADLNKAIELDPTNADAYNNRGATYGNMKNFNAAIADFNKALELNPNNAMAYNNRGGTLRYLGNVPQGLQDLTRAIELNPKLDIAYYNRAFCYISAGNMNNAISDMDKFIELRPNFAQAYFVRGQCYQMKGEFSKAQADFAKARELGYNG